jgi:hypothetical protein
MAIRLKTLRYAVAVVVCCALAADSGFAQEKAPGSDAPAAKAGSDAPRGDGLGAGAGLTSKGASDTRVSDTGDRGAGPSRPTGPQTIELGKDAGRKGPPAPGTPGPTPPNVTLSHGINLVTPDNGYAGLLRRANRKALIANAANKPVGPMTAAAANPPLPHSGREGARNAVGLVVPAGNGAAGTGAGQHPLPSPVHNGTGPSGTGVIGTGSAAVGGGADPRHLTTTPPGVALHTAGINGTTMGHIASGPGIIGGPAKDRSAINGTVVRSKH